MNVLVREYEEYDAEKISNIIIRNLFEVNIEEYGKKEIDKQAEKFKSDSFFWLYFIIILNQSLI